MIRTHKTKDTDLKLVVVYLECCLRLLLIINI